VGRRTSGRVPPSSRGKGRPIFFTLRPLLVAKIVALFTPAEGPLTQ